MRFDCLLSRTLIRRPSGAAIVLFVSVLLSITAPIAVRAASQERQPQPAAKAESPQEGSKAPAHEAGARKGEKEHAHEAGWLPVIAKTFNFAVLVGILVYYLRQPLTTYLATRISKVREDLVTAAATREAATRQLAEIDAKLKALPGELETLKRRGAEEIAAERVRIEEAAEAERQRLLEQTRREIDMRLRIARRELVEYAATLAVSLATDRIKRTITPADQARLVDRYRAQLEGARQ